MASNIFFSENRGRYEVVWRNIVEPNGPQMTIRGLRIACWITKAEHTHRHLEHVILIAFPLQQRLDESASKLRYTCFLIWVNAVEHFS